MRLVVILVLIAPFTLQGKVPSGNIEIAKVVVQSYMETIHMYSQKYEATHRFFIENQLLISPNIRIGCDIPGKEVKNYQANWYYLDLKKSRGEVMYESDLKIKINRVGNKEYVSCLVRKTIIHSDGSIRSYNEVIDLEQYRKSWRIVAIFSELFYDLSDFTDNGAPEKKLPSQKSSIVDKLLQQANKLHEQIKYAEAIKIYYEVLERKDQLLQVDLEFVGKQIADCRTWIDYNAKVSDGDAFFKIKFFSKALEKYKEALKLKPNNLDLSDKVERCTELAKRESKEKLLEQIELGTRLVEKGKITKGFGLLLRSRDSNLLSSKQLFYMAQILDTRPKKIKNEFGLTNIDCCILTRQFMIEARSKGASSEEFEFFWHANLTKKSRSCSR